MQQQNRIRDIATDPEALEAFYREHVDDVQRFVARRVADAQLAADLTADIFMAAIDAASSYRQDRGAPVAWLYGIARHVIGDEVRRQVRELKAVKRISGRRLLNPDSQARIEESIDAERQMRALYDAMAQLPAKDRALLELVAVDGLPVQEAAAVLGIKAGTARVRLHRARRHIQLNFVPTMQEVCP